MKDKWGKVYYQKLALGWDNGCAAFAADAAIKRREHVASPDCWCEPEQDHIEPDLYIHRDLQ
jgi:hypothetical protein